MLSAYSMSAWIGGSVFWLLLHARGIHELYSGVFSRRVTVVAEGIVHVVVYGGFIAARSIEASVDG
jgi:hypothetical protein